MCEKCDVGAGRSFAADVDCDACGSPRGRGFREEPLRTNNPKPIPPLVALSILNMNCAWHPMRRTFLIFCWTYRIWSIGGLGLFAAGLVVDEQVPADRLGSVTHHFQCPRCATGLP